MTKSTEKSQIEFEIRNLIINAKNKISNEKILEITNNLEKYNVLKEKLKNCKNEIKAPYKITDEMLINGIYDLMDIINEGEFDYLTKDKQTIIINKLIRKFKIFRRFCKNY